MPLSLSWKDIAIRLALTTLASGFIGANRDEQGRPAGLRTMMLVGLAAALAMIEVNLLLELPGKTGDNFNTLDPMRLPLGILSGIGFIGAGTIIKKGEMSLGVTTAATLWYVTVLGLLFGAGKLEVAMVASVLGIVVLSSMKWLERRLDRTHRATLRLAVEGAGLDEADLRRQLDAQGFAIGSWKVTLGPTRRLASLECALEWQAPGGKRPELPAAIAAMSQRAGVTLVEWDQ